MGNNSNTRNYQRKTKFEVGQIEAKLSDLKENLICQAEHLWQVVLSIHCRENLQNIVEMTEVDVGA